MLKNKDGKEQFVLIEAPGRPVLDVEVGSEKVREALAYIINKVYSL